MKSIVFLIIISCSLERTEVKLFITLGELIFLLQGSFIFLTNKPQSWRWWECCSGGGGGGGSGGGGGDRVRLYHAEAEGWISSPAGELFRWWDVDLQLWGLAKANIHLDLSGSIQLCSTLTSCSLPPFFFLLSFFKLGYELIKLFFFFLLSYPLILHRTSRTPLEKFIVEAASLSPVFFTVNWASDCDLKADHHA